MIIRHVPTVVPAEGVILERVLDATYPVWNGGLTRQAYGKLDAAQMKTAWGRHHQRRFALVDGADVLASAAQYDLAAILDQRPVRACPPHGSNEETGTSTESDQAHVRAELE
jgi:hypothetical protein